MPKFHGRIGYGETAEALPGVYVDAIVEHFYYGEIIRSSRQLRQGSELNEDISVGTSISIVGSDYAFAHSFDIRYVEWMGELWTVANVETQRPRLILTLGEVYNGPTSTTTVTP
ncbi:MAG: hypothetical protein ACJ8BW_11460 [Ktedonobacteraceae bacterium]|jgi:hypothetical protein